MVAYHRSDAATGSTVFAFAIISLLSCMVVLWSIVVYLKRKNSYHLQLMGRLLTSDVGICCCIILYFAVEHVFSDDTMKDFCNVMLPVTVFFFLSSYGWTILLALRFRDSHVRSEEGRLLPPFSFYVIWGVPLFVSSLLSIFIWSLDSVTTVQTGDGHFGKSCTFDHDSWNGIILDLVMFQTPIVLTILLNMYSYGCGLAALSNAPHSVMARQMRKAGGYLFVLIVVWVPNLVYNVVSIGDTSDKRHSGLLDFAVLLTAAQGFLNVCVYVWSNQKMRRWLWRNAVTRWRRPPPRSAPSAFKTEQSVQTAPSEDDSFSDEDENVGTWLREATSFSGFAVADPEAPAATSEVDSYVPPSSSGATASSSAVANPLSPPLSEKKTKSILIRKASNTSRNSSQHSVAHSQELDQERYVRFGETSTRIISVAATPGKSCEFLDDINHDDSHESEEL